MLTGNASSVEDTLSVAPIPSLENIRGLLNNETVSTNEDSDSATESVNADDETSSDKYEFVD